MKDILQSDKETMENILKIQVLSTWHHLYWKNEILRICMIWKYLCKSGLPVLFFASSQGPLWNTRARKGVLSTTAF